MRILSGVQPTGSIHIGAYAGAISQWNELQTIGECIFFIADLHALTVPQKPDEFQKQTLNTAVELLAAGLDPTKCI
ncbi:MAG: tryptophan--tRNA ligase, partial [Candidatus Pacebacteria bacterium]|nr:tryptophan--tRNA ligase [Candidatus Paceibacterota bacterium]